MFEKKVCQINCHKLRITKENVTHVLFYFEVSASTDYIK